MFFMRLTRTDIPHSTTRKYIEVVTKTILSVEGNFYEEFVVVCSICATGDVFRISRLVSRPGTSAFGKRIVTICTWCTIRMASQTRRSNASLVHLVEVLEKIFHCQVASPSLMSVVEEAHDIFSSIRYKNMKSMSERISKLFERAGVEYAFFCSRSNFREQPGALHKVVIHRRDVYNTVEYCWSISTGHTQ